MSAKAVLVTSSFLPGRGGIESYLAELCDAAAPSLAVLAPPERDGLRLPDDLAYTTIPGPGRMLVPNGKVVDAIESACVTHETNRVVFGTPWPLVLTGERLSARGLRYAVIVHGAELTIPAALPSVRTKLARCLAYADLLLPVSEYTARQLHTLLEERTHRVPPIEVLRARVDLAKFRPDVDLAVARKFLGLDRERPIVLCLGRLVPRKGVDRLVRAMPRIAERIPDVLAVVGGTGPQEDELRALARSIGSDVTFTGRVPNDIVPALYALADVFALPVVDRYGGREIEGLGVVLLEAQACETPCVTGRSGGTPEAVVEGATGFVIDADDEATLVDRIAGLLENAHLRRQMGGAGRRHVAENFSSEASLRPLVRWMG